MLKRNSADGANQALKFFIAGNEICFGVHFNHNTFGAANCDGDKTLSRDTARLLGSLGKALLAQPVERGLGIAAGLAVLTLALRIIVAEATARRFGVFLYVFIGTLVVLLLLVVGSQSQAVGLLQSEAVGLVR